MLDQITPLILTFNEAPNIARMLDKLRWAQRVLVIDSGSTDATADILRRYPQAETIEHPFADFASQCNFGLTRIATPWVLSLDADYVLDDAIVAEIAALAPADAVVGYCARFVYRVCGRPLRGSLYPPRTVLYRKSAARYRQEGHGHRVQLAGKVVPLSGIIYHDDRKPLARWVESQRRYARDEADWLLAADRVALSLPDRVRRLGWPAPFAVLLHALFVKGCVFDGWAGWHYALQRAIAEALIALELAERRLERRGAALRP